MASLGSWDLCRTLTQLSELPKVGKHRVEGWRGWWHLVIPTSSCVQFPCCFTNELLEVEGCVGQGLLLTHGLVGPAQVNVLPSHPIFHTSSPFHVPGPWSWSRPSLCHLC